MDSDATSSREGEKQERWNHLDLRELRKGTEYECWNCESPTTEDGACDVCGTEPHQGDGWELECIVCETVAYGDRGRNVEHDMLMHRVENCPEARFLVSPL